MVRVEEADCVVGVRVWVVGSGAVLGAKEEERAVVDHGIKEEERTVGVRIVDFVVGRVVIAASVVTALVVVKLVVFAGPVVLVAVNEPVPVVNTLVLVVPVLVLV